MSLLSRLFGRGAPRRERATPWRPPGAAPGRPHGAVPRRPHGSESWRQVRDKLRPVLRGVTVATGRPGAPPPLRRPAMPYLSEMVVVDEPTAMAYVGERQLGVWRVTAEEVFETARRNLARITAPPAGEPPDGPVMLRFVESGDAYWSSHLLLDGWLASLAERVGGRPVAFVPDRESLIVVADEPDVLEKLFDMIEADYLDAPRAISPVPYVSDVTGRTVPYDAPPGHPLSACVRRAERLVAAQEYAAQRAGLSGRFRGAELAELTLAARPDGSTFTATTWASEGVALLPLADFVGFAGTDGGLFFVPWPEVVEHVPLRPAPMLDPARYRVMGWPDGPTLTVLRAAAVEP